MKKTDAPLDLTNKSTAQFLQKFQNFISFFDLLQNLQTCDLQQDFLYWKAFWRNRHQVTSYIFASHQAEAGTWAICGLLSNFWDLFHDGSSIFICNELR